MHPIAIAALAIGSLFVVDAKVTPLGLSGINPLTPKPKTPPELPPRQAPPHAGPPPAHPGAIPIPGSPSIIVPAIPTLPPQTGLPPMPTAEQMLGALSGALGSLNPLPQVGGGPPPFVPGVLDSGLKIQEGDIINVDMFRSGMAIPQNVPAVGLIFMNVDSLIVPNDPGRKKIVATFVSPEFRILGPQIINRDSIVEKVRA